MVPVDSSRVSRVPLYSGTTKGGLHFRLQGYHLVLPDFPDRSTNAFLSLFATLSPANCLAAERVIVVLQPRALFANRSVWAVPNSLATTIGISVDLFSSGY